MRLICPNCGAQYEVPDAVVPREGRDVQCSDCGQTWFQHHADHVPEKEEPDLPAALAPTEEEVPPPAPRRVDANVKDILREEAEFESAARARDASNLESQPELGLDEDTSSQREQDSRARIARLRGEEIAQARAEAAAVAAAAGSRRELLPDIEEINSTLRSTSDRRSTSAQLRDIDPNVLERRGGGFWGGFIIVVAIVAILFGLYAYAPQIARAVPAIDPFLNSYVTSVDNGRVWLNGHILSVLEWLEDTAASQDNG